MNRVLLILGILVLLMIGIGNADSITSSIVCDGAAWVSSSVLGQGHTYAASIFTTNLASLMRSLDFGSDLKVTTVGNSAGPMGIEEYSGQIANQTDEEAGCLFKDRQNKTARTDEISASGLFSAGSYVSSRALGKQTSARYIVNGTGLMLTRAGSSDGNQSVSFGSDIAGEMNVSESIVFGDEYGN